MIAYNILWLRNVLIHTQAGQAFQQGDLDNQTLDRVKGKYEVAFYSPHFFIRVGLFILTTVILIFSFGLFALFFMDSFEKAVGGMTIFFALISFAVLEYFAASKKHFQSGVDDALLWISAGSFFGGLSYLVNAGSLANCILVFFTALYCCLRFGDRVMSIVSYIALLGIVFFLCIRLGTIAKAVVPFILMIVSVVIYLSVKRSQLAKINWLYANCLEAISVSALLSFYMAGNYYIVRELSNSMFDLQLAQNASIPLGWLFWIFTIAIPCFYISWGIKKKDILLIRAGLILVAATVYTIRYYYSLLPAEVVMTIGGIGLITISYIITRYLKTPKYGFTSLEIFTEHAKEKRAVESLLLAQTFSGASTMASSETQFGGGNFGGGGASGEF